MMDSQTPSDFAAVLLALSDTVNLVPGGLVESAFFGILSLLVAFSTYCLVKEGLNTRARVFLLCTSLIMYVVSGVHWGLNVYTLMREIEDPQAWVALPARTAWLWSFITTIALFLNVCIHPLSTFAT
ncbi:hypothetical protein BDW22DRAFT_1390822 [Trametopsis cervina]|nr:hypothetical protein BDW22DRAFT_1390822 [Trametopsis cervina]